MSRCRNPQGYGQSLTPTCLPINMLTHPKVVMMNFFCVLPIEGCASLCSSLAWLDLQSPFLTIVINHDRTRH